MKRVPPFFLLLTILALVPLSTGCRLYERTGDEVSEADPASTVPPTEATNPGRAQATTATATLTADPTATATAPAPTATASPTASATPAPAATPSPTPTPLHPLSIAALRAGEYPGSELVIEETLAPGAGYGRYVAAYESEGNTIFGLLTVPAGEPPPAGWPAIIVNHGYIPPDEYDTAQTYRAHADAFARHQYVVFVPDYRGHGNSEGESGSAYGSPNYTVDVLNALGSVQQHPAVDPERIGMFGHSLGGLITLRVMVARDDVQAGVIWAGVVSPYADLYYARARRFAGRPTPTPGADRRIRHRWWQRLAEAQGTPEENPAFWDEISANAYLEEISGPLLLQHGTADTVVPSIYSEDLKEQMDEVRRYAALNLYEGDDHNLSQNFTPAMVSAISFFDRFVKNAGG